METFRRLINSIDWPEARAVFESVYAEPQAPAVDNGTRFGFVGEYYSDDNRLRSLAHGIKNGDMSAIEESARLMAPLVERGSVLIPIPSRTGRATNTLLLAKAIAEMTGSDVFDILRGEPRQSLYTLKRSGRCPSRKYLGFFLESEPPEYSNVYFIDNVIATGTTARAALDLIPDAKVIALARDSSAEPNFEGVATDVNPPQFIPDIGMCTQGTDDNPYFDEKTVARSKIAAISAMSRTNPGVNKVFPGPGRTTLGIPGNCRHN